MTVEKIRIAATNAELVGTFYRAEGTEKATLLIHGATGVPQRFYRHFAAWAAERGLSVLTYDYRDFGESQTRPMKESDATFADWAVDDQRAAEDALSQLAPTGPLWLLGHSLGGLGLPFHQHNARIERAITVGAGLAHYNDHPWSYRPKALAFWFVIGPVAIALTGYLPGRRLFLGADLPAGVYWQWRRWCTHEGFFAVDIGKSLPQPDFAPNIPDLRITVASDDVVVPPAAVQRYAALFAPDHAQFVEISPKDHGLKSLGHIACLGPGHEAAWGTMLGLQDA